MDPGFECDRLPVGAQPHRQINPQEQQQSHETCIQQDVEKSVVGEVHLVRPAVLDLHGDPEAFLHPQRAVAVAQHRLLHIDTAEQVLPKRDAPCHICRAAEQPEKEGGIRDEDQEPGQQERPRQVIMPGLEPLTKLQPEDNKEGGEMQEQEHDHAGGRPAAKDHRCRKEIEHRKKELPDAGCLFVHHDPQQEEHAEKGKEVAGVVAVPEDAYP